MNHPASMRIVGFRFKRRTIAGMSRLCVLENFLGPKR